MDFKDLDLHKQLLSAVKKAGFTSCMPVQEKTLPVALTGSDLMVQSKTGSGKTAVFVLAFLEKYLRNKENRIDSKALIVAPTRELAQQIASDAQILSSTISGFRVGCFFGGVGYENQEKLLKKGCHIFVGTPGRLLDFIGDKKLDCKSIDTFVLDEADRMFDMGFYPDIKKLFGYLPPKNERQTMLFSATLEMRVRELAWEYMNEHVEEVELEPETITVDKITQELYHVAKSDKFALMLQLIARENAKNILIFTNSRHMTMEVAKRLSLNGYNADFLSGDLSQNARDRALSKMKEGKTSILVATDVAARGLQIDDLPLVINYDIPEDYENYVHRIGRTARAGKSGKAITLADEEFVYGLEPIEKYIKMKIPVIWPDNLPEVEDKSLGQSWGEKKPAHKAQGKKPANNRPGEKASKQEIKRAANLSKMSEEERMAYYRKKYGFEPVRNNEKKKQPEKKKSFFARLFGRKKK